MIVGLSIGVVFGRVLVQRFASKVSFEISRPRCSVCLKLQVSNLAVRSVWLLKMVSCVSRFGRLRLTFTRKRGGNGRSSDSRRGDRRIPVDVAVAQRITKVEYVIEAVIQPDGADIVKVFS